MRRLIVAGMLVVGCSSVETSIDAGEAPQDAGSDSPIVVLQMDAGPSPETMDASGPPCTATLPPDMLPTSDACMPRDPGTYACMGSMQSGILYTCPIGTAPKLAGCVDWGVIHLQFIEADRQWAMCPSEACVRYSPEDFGKGKCPTTAPDAWACPKSLVPVGGGNMTTQWSDGDFYGPVFCNSDKG